MGGDFFPDSSVRSGGGGVKNSVATAFKTNCKQPLAASAMCGVRCVICIKFLFESKKYNGRIVAGFKAAANRTLFVFSIKRKKTCSPPFIASLKMFLDYK